MIQKEVIESSLQHFSTGSEIEFYSKNIPKNEALFNHMVRELLASHLEAIKNFTNKKITEEELDTIRRNTLDKAMDLIKRGGVKIRIKALFLSANPIDTAQIDIEKEVREIIEKIRAADYRDSVELVPAFAVRSTDLLQLFNQHKPTIVHFSGHGCSSGEIILIDDNDESITLTREVTEELFRVMKDDIRMVLLNACHSQTQAEALSNVIDCTIGMNGPIGDDAAVSFAAAFYRAIGFGRSIKNAFDQALLQLKLEGLNEADCMPQLFARAGIDPAKMIFVEN